MYIVYQIYCKNTGRYYYGFSTKSLKHRKSKHLSNFRSGYHKNKYLIADFLTYGENSLIFREIQNFENKNDALLTEKTLIQLDLDCYNISIGTCRPSHILQSSGKKAAVTRKLGNYQISEETRLKMSLAKKGKSTNNQKGK